MDAHEYVTLVNRTDRPVEGVYDSRTHVFPPHAKVEVEKFKAVKFVDQNPVMGSENPRTGEMIYKMGIVELRMDCSPLSAEYLAQFEGAIEKWDRSKLIGAKPSEAVPGIVSIYSSREASTPLPKETAFVPAG